MMTPTKKTEIDAPFPPGWSSVMGGGISKRSLVMLEPGTCKCGAVFERTTPNKKYCSRACERKHREQRRKARQK